MSDMPQKLGWDEWPWVVGYVLAFSLLVWLAQHVSNLSLQDVPRPPMF